MWHKRSTALSVGFGILLIFFGLFILSRSTSSKLEGRMESAPTPETGLIYTAERIAANLDIPWDVAFLPTGEMLVTERTGNVLLLDGSERKVIATFQSEAIGEGGLLGMTLHPEFERNNWIYFYYTYDDQSEDTLLNKVERHVFRDEKLSEPMTVLNGIPGARYHDGGRVAFGPDGRLYITTGDATKPELAQDLSSLAGKILRVRDDGSIPEDNPFPGSPVFSYGHRNPQGLAWDDSGNLWSTEHGRSGVASGYDELNRIVAGGNYGWPESEGDTVLPGTVAPTLHSGPDTTWAPASAAFHMGSVWFGGLRGETLYEAVIRDDGSVVLREHFSEEFGRIRTVSVSPLDNALYFTTSNRDGRDDAGPNDDVIVRIDSR